MKDKDTFKRVLLLALCIILLILVFFFTEKIGMFCAWVLQHTKTILVAFALAFVINLPTKMFEKMLTPKKKEDKNDKKKNKNAEVIKEHSKGRRVLALLLAIMCILLVITLITTFIIPEIIDNIKGIVNNIPSYIEKCKDFLYEKKDRFNVSDNTVNQLVTYTNNTLSELGLTLENVVTETFKLTTGIASGVFSFLVSFILAIYMIMEKERLCASLKKVVYSFFKKEKADYLVKASGVFNKTFSGFVSGQIIEAIILGVLCYIGMVIFRMEYASIISVCVGVTALVPIFGAFIGAIPGVFIMLMISPMKAVWFVVYIIVLQQIEGNLIYPKVVGTSIGISGFWVLVALVIGGSIGGILGILIGIPAFAAVYILFKEVVNDKLKEKNVETVANKK